MTSSKIPALPALTAKDLEVGKTYRAKRQMICNSGGYNDRTIIHLGQQSVQYDSPAVKKGQPYPQLSILDFLKWASHEVIQEEHSNAD